ncbi:MAG: DUF1028 domain-containing protein [Candidatus Marinimicrobia bacterium]|nr:DUF1028 domain-containing protein [Candidatus Neomarinimicrobiota bacterium]
MKLNRMIFPFIIGLGLLYSQTRPVSTYSIVALDEKTGELGVAVQSHWFSVGSVVPWARAGVGAVATQSFVRVEYGPQGLDLMEAGASAEEALVELMNDDEGAEVRQVAMIDINGEVVAHTGENCIWAAGHQTGKNYSVQANLMENETVWPAMAEAFEKSRGGLADRMLAALEAAEVEGGDIRGRQSAAMLIVSGQPTGIPWKDIVLELRIEDHPDPLVELKRLIRIHRAYQHANQGDLYVEKGKTELALKEYDKAATLYPENPELPYWTAVTLADIGRVNESLPLFKAAFVIDERWRTLTPRLVNAGLLPDDKKMLELILAQ